MKELNLSNLGKTWLLDVDGTLVKHNGYLDKKETLLKGVKEFYKQISENDTVIILTSRKKELIEQLELFLQQNSLRYDYIIPNLPYGERIVINDKKPSGLKTAYAINKERDESLELKISINPKL